MTRSVLLTSAMTVVLVAAHRVTETRPQAGPAGTDAIPAPRPVQFGDTRLRHTAPVTSVAFRPDGRAVAASAYQSPVVVVWDAATGRELRRYDVADIRARVVGYTPDGRRLLVSNGSGVLAVDSATGKVLFRASVSAAAIAPNGRRLAGLDECGNLVVCEIETGRTLHTLGSVPKPASGWAGACFSPDGSQVAACADGGSVYVAPADGSRPAREVAITGQENGVKQVVWPRAGRLVAVWYNGYAIHDPDSGRQLVRKSGDYDDWLREVTAVNGRLFAKLSNTPRVVEIDPDRGGHVSGRGVSVHWLNDAVTVSADGSRVAVAEGHAVRLFDSTDGGPVLPDVDRNPTRPASAIEFSADGRRMLTAGFECVRVWDVAARRPTAVNDRDGRTISAQTARLSPDGRWVAGTDDHRVAVLDAATGAVVFRQPRPPAGTPRRPFLIGFDPGGRLWVADYVRAEITCHEVPSGRVVQTVAGFERTVYVLLSPDGRRLVVGGWTAFAVRDTDPAAAWHVIEKYPGRQPDCGLEAPPCPVPVGFTPDGRRLITSGPACLVWDVTGSPAAVGMSPLSGRGLVTSADGRRTVSLMGAGEGKPLELVVRETVTLAELGRLPLAAGVTGFGISPDGRRLVLARADTTLTVDEWEWPRFDPAGPGRPRDADGLWADLAIPDPKVGLGAVQSLVADPAAVPLLAGRFRPTDAAQVAALVGKLDSDRFAEREQAAAELAGLGAAAGPALRAAVNSPSAEVRARAAVLLRRLNPTGGGPSADHLRAVRAVEAVERVGTREARELLSAWAAGRGGPSVEAEARAAAARLGCP